MEFLFEWLFELLFVVFQFFGEMLLQVIIEILLEIGFHVAAEPFQRKPELWLAFIGYAIFGGIAGGVSLIFLPHLLIDSYSLQVVGLFASPIAAGLVMVCIGAWRRRRGDDLVRLDRFAYSFIFAFMLGLIRFAFAH